MRKVSIITIILFVFVLIGATSYFAYKINDTWYVTTSSITDHGNAATKNSLAWTIAQVSNRGDIVINDGDYQINTAITVPSGVGIYFRPGARLYRNAGASSITFQAGSFIEAGHYQIFYGDGGTVFGSGISPILSSWFGNDLNKVHNSVTSNTQILITDNSTVSSTVKLTKTHVSIRGEGAGIQYTVRPSIVFSGAMFQYGEFDDWDSVKGMDLSNFKISGYIADGGDPSCDYGVEIRNGHFSTMSKMYITQTSSHGIYFNGSDVSPTWCGLWNITISDVYVEYPRGACLYAYNPAGPTIGNTCAGNTSFIVNNLYCFYPYISGVVLDSNLEYQTKATFNNLNIQGPARHGIEVHGWWDYEVNGGFCEPRDDDNISIRTLWADDGVRSPSYGIVKDWWIEAPANKAMPLVNAQNQVKWCDSYKVSGCATLGRKDSYGLTIGNPGPPNQPVGGESSYIEYPSGWRMTDYFGNEWLSSYNARMEGDNCSDATPPTGRTVNKWIPTRMPIVLPIKAADVNTNNWYMWYPQQQFCVSNISFLNNGSLSCDTDTVISFGTADDNEAWITDMNNTVISGATQWPVQTKNISYSLIYTKPFCMASMWVDNDHIGAEDFTVNGKYNYIRGYKTGTNCTGSASLIIDGYDPGYRWNGY